MGFSVCRSNKIVLIFIYSKKPFYLPDDNIQFMAEKSEIYKQIKELEREIDTIKMLHSLGKMNLNSAKAKIKNLDAQLMKHVEKLPEYDRHLYMIKKEFGHMDNVL